MKNLNKETEQRRLTKYAALLEKGKSFKNQFLVRNGEFNLILSGKVGECEQAEGYGKFPDGYIQQISMVDFVVSFLPKGRIIFGNHEVNCFRGYKEENTSDCMILLHAISGEEEIIIVDFGQEQEKPLILVDDYCGETESVNNMLYQKFQWMLLNSGARVEQAIVQQREQEEEEDVE